MAERCYDLPPALWGRTTMEFRVLIPYGKHSIAPTRWELYSFAKHVRVFESWLASNEAIGIWDGFCDLRGIHFAFSDYGTAFAFKMRFG